MSASDIAAVRRATDEPTEQEYSDLVVQSLIDELGVAGASAHIWREKAASYAGDVDVSEAGASHKFSDLHKNALAMAAHWQGVADKETGAPVSTGRTRVRKIERT